MNAIDKSGSFDPKTPATQIEDEMRHSYMNYAMSVIVSRALPDVRDGLKPVHRRILFSMHENGYASNKPHRKSARVVGDVIGKYHPHGDQSIYDAMVRMAQDFSMSEVLVDGQGNFGSIDGDSAAAMRYTEARMSPIAHQMTEDLDKETVDFQPNYDGSEHEPEYLPAKFPNLLVNGGTGIAVGMATNIPTHNLGEVVALTLAYIANENLTVSDVMKIMPGPDFPTAGIILGRSGIRDAYETGRGSITISGKYEIVEGKGGKSQIVITELPYGVNKAKMIERFAELVNAEKDAIEGVSDIRDESDRNDKVRVVVDVKRDADANVVLSKMKKYTDLVTKYGINMVCLNSKSQPRTMGVLEVLREFVNFRRGVIRRRTIYDLNGARDALHRQIGLYAAVSDVDEVVRIIRGSENPEAAHVALLAKPFNTAGDFAALLRDADPDLEYGDTFYLSPIQAKAILELSLRSLTGLERDKIAAKARELSATIEGLSKILESAEVLDGVMIAELEEVRAKFPTPRRTQISASEYGEISEEDLIDRDTVVVTVTNTGYVKRTPLAQFREQSRGGKGKIGMQTKDDDFVVRTLVCSTHSPLIFFTSRGVAHTMKAYTLPDAPVSARGRPIVNYLTLRQGEKISALVAMPEDANELADKALMFVTDFGSVRRSAAVDFANMNKAGKMAIQLENSDGVPQGELIEVILADPKDDIMLATESGMATRFQIEGLRVVASRRSTGVRGMQVAAGDKVVSACVLPHVAYNSLEREAYFKGGTATGSNGEQEITVTLSEDQMEDLRKSERQIVTITSAGFGKRSSSHEYRVTERGGKGSKAAIISNKTGGLVMAAPAGDDDGLMLITTKGKTIRISANEIRISGRATRGVSAFNVGDDSLASAAVIVSPDIDEVS